MDITPKTYKIMEDTTYNGWKNHATWNVALWIGGDQGLYEFAKEMPSYEVFKDSMREMSGDSSIGYQTPDGVSWNDSGLDIPSLDEMIKELS
jgi:hypothetical protein